MRFDGAVRGVFIDFLRAEDFRANLRKSFCLTRFRQNSRQNRRVSKKPSFELVQGEERYQRGSIVEVSFNFSLNMADPLFGRTWRSGVHAWKVPR